MNFFAIICYNSCCQVVFFCDNSSEIDVDYYLKLGESVAPTLLKNVNIIEAQMKVHTDRPNKQVWLRYTDINAFKDQLEFRASNYLERLNETDWPSWSYADSKMQKTTVLISPAEKEQFKLRKAAILNRSDNL